MTDEVFMHVILYVIAFPIALLALVVGKGVTVRKAIVAGQYSWRNFSFFVIAWFAWTSPGLETVCTEIGCRYSMRFGWFLSIFDGSIPLDPGKVVALAMAGYFILTLYFLGHCAGWLIHWAGRLRRQNADGAA